MLKASFIKLARREPGIGRSAGRTTSEWQAPFAQTLDFRGQCVGGHNLLPLSGDNGAAGQEVFVLRLEEVQRIGDRTGSGAGGPPCRPGFLSSSEPLFRGNQRGSCPFHTRPGGSDRLKVGFRPGRLRMW